jgi:hypothetical protein
MGGQAADGRIGLTSVEKLEQASDVVDMGMGESHGTELGIVGAQ